MRIVRILIGITAIPIFTLLGGCIINMFGDEETFKRIEHDMRILESVFAANPSSIDSSEIKNHAFTHSYRDHQWHFYEDLDLSGLELNDTNFYFPPEIEGFVYFRFLKLSGNEFTRLPRGIKYKAWESVSVYQNSFCSPDSETVAYLSEIVVVNPNERGLERAGEWWKTQICPIPGP